MKTSRHLLLGSLLFAGLLLGLTSCATDGYVGVDTGVYYGGGPWFHDGPWVDGHGWYGGGHGAYIHPAAFHGRATGHRR